MGWAIQTPGDHGRIGWWTGRAFRSKRASTGIGDVAACIGAADLAGGEAMEGDAGRMREGDAGRMMNTARKHHVSHLRLDFL